MKCVVERKEEREDKKKQMCHIREESSISRDEE